MTPELLYSEGDLRFAVATAKTEIERLTAERDAARLIAIQQTDYAIGLQRAIEAHCRDEVVPEDVCPHHAEKLNLHFNRTEVLEKEHKEFYAEAVELRATTEHLRLREERMTTERDAAIGELK